MSEMNQNSNAYLAEAPVGTLLLKFSIPCVLSMLVSALYNIVDQIFIGQSVGYLGNAATNVVYPFTVLALALALLIGDGSAALLSLSLGAGDQKVSRHCIGNGILMTAIIGFLLMFLGFLFTDPILKLFGVTDTNYSYAWDYFRIILIGIPFYIVSSGMNAAIRADGSPGYSMFATVIGAVLNLILDPVAIFILNMGVKGAAIATVIGQIASCVMTVLYFRKPKSFRFHKDSFKLNRRMVKKIGQLGISSFITQIAIVIIIGIANNMIVLYGPLSPYGADIPLSAVGIVMKVFGIVIAFSIGIAVGGQPIIGYNYGAGNYKRVASVYRLVLLGNIAVGVLATLLFEFCPQIIVRLFGSESALYNEYANLCFRIYLSGILLCCVQKASSIFLQAIGMPVKATILSLSRDVVFLVPGVVLFTKYYGVTGMLWAAPVADVLSIILTALLVFPVYHAFAKKQKKTEAKSKITSITGAAEIAD